MGDVRYLAHLYYNMVMEQKTVSSQMCSEVPMILFVKPPSPNTMTVFQKIFTIDPDRLDNVDSESFYEFP